MPDRQETTSRNQEGGGAGRYYQEQQRQLALDQKRQAEEQKRNQLGALIRDRALLNIEGQKEFSGSPQERRAFINKAAFSAQQRSGLTGTQRLADAQKQRQLWKKANLDPQGAPRSQKLAPLEQPAQTARAAATAFTEVSGDDWYHWLVIGISILADLFTLIPFLGTFLAIVFGIFIWLIYAINGHFKVRVSAKAMTLVITIFLEILPFLDALPFFTGSAIINYWLCLAEKKAKKQNQ